MSCWARARGARARRRPATTTGIRSSRRGAGAPRRPLSGAGLVDELKALPDGIVRAKGLLHLHEDPANRYVLQAVGRRFSIQADRPWGDDARASQLVVVGLPGSVDVARLEAAFAQLTTAGA